MSAVWQRHTRDIASPSQSLYYIGSITKKHSTKNTRSLLSTVFFRQWRKSCAMKWFPSSRLVSLVTPFVAGGCIYGEWRVQKVHCIDYTHGTFTRLDSSWIYKINQGIVILIQHRCYNYDHSGWAKSSQRSVAYSGQKSNALLANI